MSSFEMESFMKYICSSVFLSDQAELLNYMFLKYSTFILPHNIQNGRSSIYKDTIIKNIKTFSENFQLCLMLESLC